MKRLIFVNGTMGVGKTATCEELLQILQPSVFLDGDWCWRMNPFTVTPETKRMVMDNIVYMLRSFLRCSAYQNILFCWVMHEQSIMDEIIRHLCDIEYMHYRFTLAISPQALERRLWKDVHSGVRKADVIERSLARVPSYDDMDTVKIDVSTITPKQAAVEILRHIERRQ